MKYKYMDEAYLRQYFNYCPDMGIFTWKKNHPNGKKKGQLAGRKTVYGYWVFTVNRETYFAHRVAWLFMNHENPPDAIDHINGNRLDNRIDNLRPASYSQNQWNAKPRPSKSGYRGVCVTRHGKYASKLTHKYKVINLGTYSNPTEAHMAYCYMAKHLRGEFANFENPTP